MQLCAAKEGVRGGREEERERVNPRRNVTRGTGGRETRECNGRRETKSAACSSDLTGGRGKGYNAVPQGLGTAPRAQATRREFARGVSLSSFPSPLPSPPSLSLSLPYPVFSSYPFRRESSYVLLGLILRQPFRYFFVSRLVESEDSQQPIEITRTVVFGLRAYRMVQRSPRKPANRGTFLNPFGNIVAPRDGKSRILRCRNIRRENIARDRLLFRA